MHFSSFPFLLIISLCLKYSNLTIMGRGDLFVCLHEILYSNKQFEVGFYDVLYQTCHAFFLFVCPVLFL